MAAGLAEIIVLSLLADWVFRRVGLPGLVGMITVGFLTGPHVLSLIDPELLAIGPDLRLIALIVILLRVGFELSRKTLHRIGVRVLLLGSIPSLCEGLAVALAGYLLLGLSLIEAALLASVLAAVSPAVVMPMMMRFQKELRGTARDIPSLVMAAASLDNVFVILVNGALLSLYIGNVSNLAWKAVELPISLLTGTAAGLLTGTILCRLFDRFDPRATKRVLIVLAASILAVRLQYITNFAVPLNGLLFAMAMGFIILEKCERAAHEISAKLGKIWVFAEVILFTLVGAQVDPGIVTGHGTMEIIILLPLVMVIGLLARSCGVLISLGGSRLEIRERLFVAVAFLPKATVQAAIGASPLLAMRAAGLNTAPGDMILAAAVLSIVITAPVGALAISALGRRVLKVEQ